MNNAVINFPLPANEPVKAYMPGSPERVALLLLPSGPDRVHSPKSHGTLAGGRPRGTNFCIIKQKNYNKLS